MRIENLLRPKPGARSTWIRACLLRYGIAFLFILAAAVIRLSLDSFLGQEVVPYSFFYVAVALTAWGAGFRPAIFASLLGLIIGIWLIVPPRFSLRIRGSGDVIEIGVYLFVTTTLSVLITSLCRARAQAQASMAIVVEKQRELEAEIRQRMETEAALRRSEILLEQRVKERTAELQEMVDELHRFSYAIIHDMRAPLRSMRGFADVIEEDSSGSLPASSREYLRRIQTACGRMDRLIQDSLNYNKALLKNLPLQPVDLSKLVRELCATYPNLRPFQGSIRVEGKFPMVLGNDAALTQCFSILLGNAVKFVAEGVEPKIRLWADQNDKWATISVKDNGIGIPASTQRHLFGIFQRHDSLHDGTGIGLAIVRKLAQRMGGKVGVESEVGKGSRFWLELKLAATLQSSVEPSTTATVAGEKSQHNGAHLVASAD